MTPAVDVATDGGAEAWYDEAFGTAIAAFLRAIAKQRHHAARAAGALRAARPQR